MGTKVGCSQGSNDSCQDIFEDSDVDIFDDEEPGPSRDFDGDVSSFVRTENIREGLGEPPPKVSKSDQNRTSEEEKLAKSLAKLRDESAGGLRQFGRYMQLKKDKLRYQVNVVSRVDKTVSNIFNGISIFVNGHTDPSALELRELIQIHGGEYHCYMEYGTTIYTVASSLASAKIDKTRKDTIFIVPGWIIDCIAAGKLLPIDGYRLIEGDKEAEAPITRFFGKTDKSLSKERTLDARDPNFIQEYYARSRLHLISTLAQEMKDYILYLHETNQFTTEEVDKISLPGGNQLVNENVIFHIDLDSFFVSVALRDRPDLQDKPVAITHSRGSASAPGFSEVASVSYAARKLGMKNGMLVRDALKLCPTLACLPYQFEEYKAVSKCIYTLISKFGAEVRAVSCDEIYVNFTAICTERKISNIIGLANHIRSRIREETRGCPASVGIGPSLLLARLATRKAKPDGVYWVRKREAMDFVANEKLENIPGIGYMTIQKLKEKFGEVDKCNDLQYIDPKEFESLFGKVAGKQIYQHIRGEDTSPLKNFMAASERKSVSCDINYGIRFTKREEVLTFLGRVADEVSKKLNSCRRLTGAVTLKLLVRCSDAPVETSKYLGTGKCDSYTKTSLVKGNTDNPARLTKEIISLYDEISPVIEDLRGIGVHCGRLVPSSAGVRKLQFSKNFFEPRPAMRPQQKQKKVDQAAEKTKTIVPEVMDMPKFNGMSNMKQIKSEMQAIFLEEPNETNVRLLSTFLLGLHEYRAYSTLRVYALHLGRLVSNSDTRSAWAEVLYTIFGRLDMRIHFDWGGNMFENLLRSNPLTNNGCKDICYCTDSHAYTCRN